MDLSIEDLKSILCGSIPTPVTNNRKAHGYCIAVLDKGFVYVGDVYTDAEYVYVESAKNVRKWTGGHGLSWYAKAGFDDDIVLDDSGPVKAPASELKHLIVCDKRA